MVPAKAREGEDVRAWALVAGLVLYMGLAAALIWVF